MALNKEIVLDSGVTTTYHKLLGANWGGEYVKDSDGNFVLDDNGDKILEFRALMVSYLDKESRDNDKKAVLGKEYLVGVSMSDILALVYSSVNELDNFTGATEI